MQIFASTGVPGRIGDVHIDVIEEIRAPRRYDRTTVSLENGKPATAHRQRVPFQIVVRIVISDVEPVFAALAAGLWERDHANKTRRKLEAIAEDGAEVTFFDGEELWLTPTGSRRWTIDDIDSGKDASESNAPGLPKVWRASITLGEVARFGTSFTSVDAGIDPSIQDASDGVVDKGQQSTEAVPADIAAQIDV